MQLFVARLNQDPTELVFRGTPEWLVGLAADPELTDAIREEIRFTLRAHRMNEDLYLEGEATGSYELRCGRCLKRYRQPVHEPFRLVLEPAGSRSPADPEGAAALVRDGLWLSEELEAGWFRGSEVRLDHFLHEVVAAGLPPKPLCREECAGLCATCGKDRNLESCDCREQRPASPFSALAGLRDQLAKHAAGEGEET